MSINADVSTITVFGGLHNYSVRRRASQYSIWPLAANTVDINFSRVMANTSSTKMPYIIQLTSVMPSFSSLDIVKLY